MITKVCKKCEKELPLDSFPTTKQEGKIRTRARCRTCTRLRDAELFQINKKRRNENRRRYRKNHPEVEVRCTRRKNARKWGLDPDTVMSIVDNHNGLCDICGQPDKMGRSLSMDHCHKTSNFRGFLCVSCNSGIGNFMDNPNLLEKAILYLKRNPLLRPDLPSSSPTKIGWTDAH